ncbi:phasin family protein [Rugamonas sp. CCM 8940]|uniref:phasin family protein n=1 Tax=Rugamonas sp. CCM 8940 TaxID=2765359 RepID=UPI00351C87FD
MPTPRLERPLYRIRIPSLFLLSKMQLCTSDSIEKNTGAHMVKKLKTLAKDNDKQLAGAVRSSAQQIWQAGLGAFAKAQEEGGRVFSKLVKEGTDLQKRTRSIAEEKVADVRETVSGLADDVGSKAAGSWDKLEQVFEDRVARALGSIGVPTQKDIQALTKRVEQLSKTVAELSGKKLPVVKEAAKAAPTAAKAAPKVASKTAAKAAPKAAAKPVAKTKAKAAAKPAAKTAAKPAAKPAVKAPAKPAVKAAAKPAAKPVAKPTAKPAAKSAANAATKPAAKPATKPTAKAAAKPTAKPAAKIAAKPAISFPTAASVTAAAAAKKPAAKTSSVNDSDKPITPSA